VSTIPDLLRLAADRLERDPTCGLDDLAYACDLEHDTRHAYGGPKFYAILARRYTIGFSMRVAEPPGPCVRCRCGLTTGHEPTCPELP
jgi:hypothetical protein